MGGKTKQSQRTKNNVRPSSSSRSAELLSNAVTLEGGLVNLGGGKVLPALFPSLATANFDQALNPEFQMCIKKLNKKDPITRAKALQELCELVNNGSVDDVVAALPSWALCYRTLTADTDRKVREMTQLCHGSVARAAGRRLAPQLRALVPAWLQAQHDEHAPAQAHAQHSLKSTFPDNKLPEVISFCKAEVMAHVLDNLVGTAEALINKKIESQEERDLQWSRVVSSSLQGLEYFTQHLPSAHDDWLWTELTPLLQHNSFWKFHNHSSNPVRAAWYAVTGRIIERFKDTFGEQYGMKTMKILVGVGKEQNALVAAQLWTCVLLLMVHVKDWHTYLDKKELFVKRIIDVLDNGGWGDAKHLANLLLPLLAHLPADMKTKQFYETFFKALFTGLSKKTVLNSKSERQSWITSLAECLRYLSIQQNDFVVEVATSVHRTWLETIVSPEHEGLTRTNLIKTSAANMTSLLKYWLKQSKEEKSEKYDQLVRNFWQNVGATVLTQIDKCTTDRNDIEKLIDGHILLLQNLKTTFLQEAKKQQSIKFDDDQTATPVEPSVGNQQCDASIVERFKHNLDDLVHKICSHYFETASIKEISCIVTPLITLLKEFDSKQLFLAVGRQFGVDSVYKLYDKVFRTWLSGDTMRSEAVVDVVLLIMKYMTEDEQKAMFDSFQQFPPLVVEWCMSSCARHPHVRAPSARSWLRGDVTASTLRVLAARASRADARASGLLLVCLADGPDGKCLVNDEAVSSVLKILTEAIWDPASTSLETSASLAARLATTLQHAGPTYHELVFALFRLNVLVPRCGGALSLDTWLEVRASWQDGAAALAREQRASLLARLAQLLHQQLLDSTASLDAGRLEHVVALCPHVFSGGDERPADVRELLAFSDNMLHMSDIESHVVEAAALRHECVTSQLNCLYPDNDCIKTVIEQPTKELTEMDLLPYINRVLFRAIYLRTMFLHKGSSDYDEEDQNCWCDVLMDEEYFQEEFCNVVYNYVIVDSLHEAYAFWAHYELIEQTRQKLQSVLDSIVSVTSAEHKAKVQRTLRERGAARGYAWALAQRCHAVRAALHEPAQNIDEHSMDDISSGNGFFHTLQASTRWSEDETSEASHKIKYLVMLRSWWVAHGDTLRANFVRDALAGRDTCDPDVIVNAYYEHNHTMLYETDITDAPWAAVVSNVAVVEFLTSLVQTRGWSAAAHHWDFTTITLSSLLSSLHKSQRGWKDTKVALLARAVLRLFAAVRTFVANIRAECEWREPPAHVADLMSEWKDIFAPDAHHSLFCFVLHVLESSSSTLNSNEVSVIAELLPCCHQLSWDSLTSAHKLGPLAAERVTRGALGALRAATPAPVKQLAYTLLVAMTKPLVLADAEKLSLWSEDSAGDEVEKERPQLALDLFHDTFAHLHDIVDSALINVEIASEICEMVPHSDSYNMSLGWLLLADVLTQLCRLARHDLTHHYIQIYGERKYAEAIIKVTLRLLPGEVFAFAQDNTNTATKPQQYEDMFLRVPDYNIHVAARSAHVSALACGALRGAVCGAGSAGARGWWGAAPARAARLLERVVAAYVAPRAVRDQLTNLQQRAHEIQDAEIRIAWSSNEVVCAYNVEERFIELRIALARTHPLNPPRLSLPAGPTPGANTHWVALYLAYQNGTLLNALKMWTRAVSARVESAPQCYICYCRLHPNSGRLPRVPCHQCKNKFHSLCLRKWFATSNKSNCPLCRAAF